MRGRAPRSLWVAHPDCLVSEGLAAALGSRSSFAVTHCCVDPCEIPSTQVERLPDIFLVDEVSAARIVDAPLTAAGKGMAIVVLAEKIHSDLVELALALPADGVLMKSLSTTDAIAALEHIIAGQGVFPVGWSTAVAVKARFHACAELTPREREVLDLVAAGFSNSEIAGRMFVSPHTVKFHLRRVYAKLGVRNRVEAARLARR